MSLKQSEAIVLRTYPLREADLLVTLFTRAEGKVKGIARAAKKSKRRFGGALEPLTWVRVYYDDREGQELARLDSCDILESPLSSTVDYPRVVALEHVAEALDELLPDREANDAIFRLAVSVLHQLRSGSIWMPLTYFQLWLVRLVGFLPELSECSACGQALNGSRAFYHALCRRPDVRATQAAGVVGTYARSRVCWRLRCFVLRWTRLRRSLGRRARAPTCESSWCRFLSAISRRSW